MNIRVAIAALATLIAFARSGAGNVCDRPRAFAAAMGGSSHIGFSNQHGNFGKATGKVTLDRAAKTGSIEVTIDAASIRTYDGRLDAIVKGERFFNVEKYPTITFKSNKVKFDGDARRRRGRRVDDARRHESRSA